MKERYELVQGPDDLWMVWDKEAETPVVFAHHLLQGMSKSEAQAACDVANRVHKRRRKIKGAA